jgi:hypothetical protein
MGDIRGKESLKCDKNTKIKIIYCVLLDLTYQGFSDILRTFYTPKI